MSTDTPPNRLPNGDRDHIRSHTDILRVIGEYLPLERLPDYLEGVHSGCCPFHDDPDRSLWVDGVGQRFGCFACRRTGDVVNFVAYYERITVDEAVRLLAMRLDGDKGSQSL